MTIASILSDLRSPPPPPPPHKAQEFQKSPGGIGLTKRKLFPTIFLLSSSVSCTDVMV